MFQITRIINSREASANIRSPVSHIKIQLHILQQFSITDETSIIFFKKNKPPSHDIKVHAQKSKESRRYKGTSRFIEATCTESQIEVPLRSRRNTRLSVQQKRRETGGGGGWFRARKTVVHVRVPLKGVVQRRTEDRDINPRATRHPTNPLDSVCTGCLAKTESHSPLDLRSKSPRSSSEASHEFTNLFGTFMAS